MAEEGAAAPIPRPPAGAVRSRESEVRFSNLAESRRLSAARILKTSTNLAVLIRLPVQCYLFQKHFHNIQISSTSPMAVGACGLGPSSGAAAVLVVFCSLIGSLKRTSVCTTPSRLSSLGPRWR